MNIAAAAPWVIGSALFVVVASLPCDARIRASRVARMRPRSRLVFFISCLRRPRLSLRFLGTRAVAGGAAVAARPCRLMAGRALSFGCGRAQSLGHSVAKEGNLRALASRPIADVGGAPPPLALRVHGNTRSNFPALEM